MKWERIIAVILFWLRSDVNIIVYSYTERYFAGERIRIRREDV